LFLQRRPGNFLTAADFKPSGRWVIRKAVAYPLEQPYPKILRGHRGFVEGLAFAPDGSWVASTSREGELIQWPLSPEAGTNHRVLLNKERLAQVAVDPLGRFLVAAPGSIAAEPLIVNAKDGSLQMLEVDGEGAAWRVAVDPQGRRVAATFIPEKQAGRLQRFIRVTDLETGAVKALETGEFITLLKFTPQGHLLFSGRSGDLRSWNVDEDISVVLLERSARVFDVSPDNRTLVGIFDGRASVHNLENGSRRELTSHGSRINDVALDPTGRLVVTGDADGVVRVGPLTGEEPHLLLGHEGAVTWVRVSPKGDWIASGAMDHTVRLWPIPNMDKRPFHTLSYEEFLERLRGLTNLRAVPDDESPTGYLIDISPFPGWEKVPEW
jgi:WD40 repeat protein